jgi:Flp pilus assembly protein TadB
MMEESKEDYAESLRKRKEAERERILKQIEENRKNRSNKKDGQLSKLQKNSSEKNSGYSNSFGACLYFYLVCMLIFFCR